MSSKYQDVMAEIKKLVPWFHDNKIRLELVYIRSQANLVDAPSRQRGLDMWSLQQSTQQELLDKVEATWGSQVCTDPFACRHSTVAPRFATFGKSVSVKSKRYPPTDRANLGLKECSSFPLLITSCRHRIFGSGRTIRASSSLSSIERCNCGQWSSTEPEKWSSSSLCAIGHPR